MKAKRRRHEPEFEARVALEALKGLQTIQQIAKNFDIHPMQFTERKKAMAAGASGVFGPKAARRQKPRISSASAEQLEPCLSSTK